MRLSHRGTILIFLTWGTNGGIGVWMTPNLRVMERLNGGYKEEKEALGKR